MAKEPRKLKTLFSQAKMARQNNQKKMRNECREKLVTHIETSIVDKLSNVSTCFAPEIEIMQDPDMVDMTKMHFVRGTNGQEDLKSFIKEILAKMEIVPLHGVIVKEGTDNHGAWYHAWSFSFANPEASEPTSAK